jgi:tripartite-type tricarboxylate transporter receptor subunit TctC
MRWGVLLTSLMSVLFATATLAQETYPNRPVRVIVGLGAGSSTDVTARVITQKMGQVLGQTFVVENRTGAGGNIATGFVANSTADGYTLLFGSAATTVNVTLAPSTSFDLVKDFAPVALLATVPNILVVHPSLGVKTMEELIAKARSKPDEIFYASSGNGTSPHLSAELFKLMTGTKLTHVPYQGSAQAMQDLIAGRTNMMFVPAPTALTQLGSGGMIALASTQLKRAGAAPDLPTMDELGLKGFDTGVWFGLYAPAGTPKAIVDRLAQVANEALKADDVRTAFKSQGIDAIGSTPEEFAVYVRSEIDKWAKVVNAAGLKR